MGRTRIKNYAIASLPIAALILAIDIAEPGYGAFANPIFYVKSIASRLDADWAQVTDVNPTDKRLRPCATLLDPSIITDHQASLRKALIGESEGVAVQWLGVPACQLADGSYRWLTEAGLALDVTFDEWSRVDRAKLNR
ncbi:MAG: hypothetical protein AAF152_09380 [Cyanobacteria bacterium P01_A01_bin.114]